MRRHKLTLIGATVAAVALTASLLQAQVFRRRRGEPAPPPPPPSPAVYETAIGSANARQLLRNGLDYLESYGDPRRALRFLRQAEANPDGLDPSEVRQLALSIERAEAMAAYVDPKGATPAVTVAEAPSRPRVAPTRTHRLPDSGREPGGDVAIAFGPEPSVRRTGVEALEPAAELRSAPVADFPTAPALGDESEPFDLVPLVPAVVEVESAADPLELGPDPTAPEPSAPVADPFAAMPPRLGAEIEQVVPPADPFEAEPSPNDASITLTVLPDPASDPEPVSTTLVADEPSPPTAEVQAPPLMEVEPIGYPDPEVQAAPIAEPTAPKVDRPRDNGIILMPPPPGFRRSAAQSASPAPIPTPVEVAAPTPSEIEAAPMPMEPFGEVPAAPMPMEPLMEAPGEVPSTDFPSIPDFGPAVEVAAPTTAEIEAAPMPMEPLMEAPGEVPSADFPPIPDFGPASQAGVEVPEPVGTDLPEPDASDLAEPAPVDWGDAPGSEPLAPPIGLAMPAPVSSSPAGDLDGFGPESDPAPPAAADELTSFGEVDLAPGSPPSPSTGPAFDVSADDAQGLSRPETLREVEEMARRQDEEYRRNPPAYRDLNAPLSDTEGLDFNLGSEVTGRVTLPRPPSPTEPRPIKPIPVPSDFVPLEARNFQPNRKLWAAAAPCHGPLYFQDAVLERYGQNVEQALGPHYGRFASYPLDDPRQSIQRNQLLQPFYSTGIFALQIAALPYNLVAHPPWRGEYDLGYYRPGDPTPPDLTYLPLRGVGRGPLNH